MNYIYNLYFTFLKRLFYDDNDGGPPVMKLLAILSLAADLLSLVVYISLGLGLKFCLKIASENKVSPCRIMHYILDTWPLVYNTQ